MRAMSSACPRRRIILHCDINRTLIQTDPAGGKTLADVLNTNIADRVPGQRTAVDGTTERWLPLSNADPSVGFQKDPLTNHTLSYSDFVDNVLHPKPTGMDGMAPGDAAALWATVSAARRSLKHSFTDAGQPGEAYRSHWERLDRAMRSPAGTPWFIIPSFFHAVNSLSTADWPFSVVFRTFGHDLDDVMSEWSAFVMGTHPHFQPQGPVLAAAKERIARECTALPDEPLSASWIAKGNIYRDASGTYIVYGDDGKPPKAGEDGVAVYRSRGFTPERTTDMTLGQHVIDACDAKGPSALTSLGLVDYYPWWAAHGEDCSAGKVFPVLTRRVRTTAADDDDGLPPYQIFFDDNVRPGRRSIVDFRLISPSEKDDGGDGGTTHVALSERQEVRDAFMVCVEPWEAILQEDYFSSQLMKRLPLQDAIFTRLARGEV